MYHFPRLFLLLSPQTTVTQISLQGIRKEKDRKDDEESLGRTGRNLFPDTYSAAIPLIRNNFKQLSHRFLYPKAYVKKKKKDICQYFVYTILIKRNTIFVLKDFFSVFEIHVIFFFIIKPFTHNFKFFFIINQIYVSNKISFVLRAC